MYLLKGRNMDATHHDICKAGRNTLERGGRIFLYAFNERDNEQLKEILCASSIHYEQVFEGILPPYFTMYEVTKLEP